MKKVLAFVLILAIALGGMVFAHIAVSDSQDELIFYPTLEEGDPAVMEGLSASMTFACGDHLRWHTEYPFGGEASTEFVYHRRSVQEPTRDNRSRLEVYVTNGMSCNISGGEFCLNNNDYGPLLQAVAKETPQNGTKTMDIEILDHISYYLPDYELQYEDDTKTCSETATPYNSMIDQSWYEYTGSYRSLMEAFCFPVQPGDTLSVTVQKDDMGRIVGLQLDDEQCPELYFLSDVTAEGIWFLPVFRDESGSPLAYESPEGHGIYFVPWMHDDSFLMVEGRKEQVTPSFKKAELRLPLDEHLQILQMIIDGDAGTAQMLTLEDGSYILTTCDLKNGTVLSRLELLRHDPSDTDPSATFFSKGAYLLFLLQDTIALTDAAGETLFLTAPEPVDQHYGLRIYDNATGAMYFDGETLILADSTWFREGTFWAAAWTQDALRFYGEYDCSLMRGNENWYYSSVTAEHCHMELHPSAE